MHSLVQLINESDLILGLYEHNSPAVFKPFWAQRKEKAMSVLATAHKFLNFLECYASDAGPCWDRLTRFTIADSMLMVLLQPVDYMHGYSLWISPRAWLGPGRQFILILI
jgi:hypothetical protein